MEKQRKIAKYKFNFHITYLLHESNYVLGKHGVDSPIEKKKKKMMHFVSKSGPYVIVYLLKSYGETYLKDLKQIPHQNFSTISKILKQFNNETHESKERFKNIFLFF